MEAVGRNSQPKSTAPTTVLSKESASGKLTVDGSAFTDIIKIYFSYIELT